MGRRPLLKAAGAATVAALVGVGIPCAGQAAPQPKLALAAPARSSPAPAAPPASQAGAASETVYAFNVGSRDVSLIDATTQQVRETRPLGAAVRWLSNEQRYWDGGQIWTYDFPQNRLRAIALDPQTVAITRTIADIGTGPGHSLMVLSNGKAAINVAGDDLIAFLDLASGQVEATLATGAFP